MKIVTTLTIVVLAFAGLAKADKPLQPKDIAPAEFKAHFARVDSPESMRSTEFQGIEGGKATIAVSKMNPLTKKFSKQLVTVKLADLDPAFRAEVEAYWAKKQKEPAAPGTAPAEKANYQGDGKYQDHGPDHVIARRVLNLGRIDLNSGKNYEFDLENLPHAEFLAGLVIDMPYVIGKWEKPAWFKDVQVKMTLTDVATNKPVFGIDQDLGEFTVTNASPKQGTTFLYGAEALKTLSSPVVGLFTPAKDQKFKLTLEIKSATNKALPASLFVIAQGDKSQPRKSRSRKRQPGKRF